MYRKLSLKRNIEINKGTHLCFNLNYTETNIWLCWFVKNNCILYFKFSISICDTERNLCKEGALYARVVFTNTELNLRISPSTDKISEVSESKLCILRRVASLACNKLIIVFSLHWFFFIRSQTENIIPVVENIFRVPYYNNYK